MSKTRYINTEFWNDSWVVDNLNPLDRHLFLYLLTNPQTNLIGCYKLSLRIMSFQTGIEKEELGRMLKRLEPKVYYVEGWVILRNGIRNQYYRNEKIKSGILREAEGIPAHILEQIVWPDDFDNPKPKGSPQQQLIVDDLDMIFDQKSVDKKSTVDKKPVDKKTTASSVRYPMHDSSHLTVTKPNSKTYVSGKPDSAGKSKRKTNATNGKNYFEVTAMYEDLEDQDLVDPKFKASYCEKIFKIGIDRVRVLASQAKADGKDELGRKKLFNYLLREELKNVAKS